MEWPLCYAISGGPQYPGSTDLSGSYAGVLKPKRQARPTPVPSDTGTPTPTPSPTPTPIPSPEDRNSLGVFSVAVPQSGLGTGSFVLFSHGEIYSGSIHGEADPTHASLDGVLQSSTSTSALTNEVNGTMHARALHTITSPFNSVGVQLRGHAMLDFENAATPDNVVRTEYMRVLGFKQTGGSSSVTPSPLASATPSPTPTPTPTATPTPSATPTPTP